jgi:hypothetical protein
MLIPETLEAAEEVDLLNLETRKRNTKSKTNLKCKKFSASS